MIHCMSRHLNRNFISRSKIKLLKTEFTKTFSTQIQLDSKVTKESEIYGFAVHEIEEIPELQLTAIRLNHLRTGADYLHIARNDSNNVFCIGFKTTPIDSTGVPHILEHTVLCGSQKFPCRDPFFKMLNRSLSTFMNAFTGSDSTFYPFSTQNPIDYKNLMSIYLDAVFKPNLTNLDFMQEGWRLEHSDISDQKSPLIFKGVVFNEMKGVFADTQNIFMQKLQNSLFPSHTYGHVSGGRPLDIVNLTWEDLKRFHSTHYHPSNCNIFSYGSFSLSDHLEFIDREYLRNFEKITSNTFVPLEPKWTKPQSDKIYCPVDSITPINSQNSIAVAYMLEDIQNDFENFVFAIIAELLIVGPNSPFYKELIEPQLGSGFSPASGFDNSIRNTSFTVGLQGVKDENLNKIANIIENTFKSVYKAGFDSERIEAILHNIELSLKHQTSNFGLGLVMSMNSLWIHGGDIVNAFKINDKIRQFRELLKNNPNFLQKYIRKYFLDNTHKYTLTMSPKIDYESEISNKENEVLNKKIEILSKEEKIEVWNAGHILQSKQEMKDDLSSLPTLSVSDIPKLPEEIDLENIKLLKDIPLQLSRQPTNGVTYFNAVLSTKSLPKDLLKYIPLYCSILTSMGAGDLDFREFSQKAELVSGGLDTSLHIANSPENQSQYEEGIYLHSYCLHKNLNQMLDLWSKVLNKVCLNDESRFESLLKMIATEKSNSLIQNGHSYAMAFAASNSNYVSHRNEESNGLTQLKFLKKLSERNDFGEVLKKLRKISDVLLNSNSLRFAVNVSPDNADETVKCVEGFVNSLNSPSQNDSLVSVPDEFIPNYSQTHHVLPFPVNYTSKAFTPLPYTHQHFGPLAVLARLMFQYLHREIREKGGAYGGGTRMDTGLPFTFYSYRDPNSTQTIKTFDSAIDWVIQGDFSQQDIDEAKLGVFQKVDHPVAPGSKGLDTFLNHITYNMKKNHRKSILEAQKEDLIKVCETHLKGKESSACIIGPENSETSNNPQWNTIFHSS